MNPAEYLDAIKTRLFTEPVVVQVEIRHEQSRIDSPALRVKTNLHLLQEGKNRGQTGLACQKCPDMATIHAASPT